MGLKREYLLFIFFMLSGGLAYAQTNRDEVENSDTTHTETWGDSTEYEEYYEPFYPMLRLGVYYNPIFSTAKVRKTDFDGARDSRTGYTSSIWGISARLDLRTIAIETGAGYTERKIDLSSRTNKAVDKQQVAVSYRINTIDVPLLIHFLPVWPDSYSMFTPFFGASFNFKNGSTLIDASSATTTSDSGFLSWSSKVNIKEPKVGLSLVAGLSLLKYVNRIGTFEFGLSYQVDMFTMPKITTSYIYNYDNTIQPDRTYTYTFKTINQGIRFRVAYVFLNRELGPRYADYDYQTDSLGTVPTDNSETFTSDSLSVPVVNPVPADSSLKPERFNRIKF
jgi:hypothetical protein